MTEVAEPVRLRADATSGVARLTRARIAGRVGLAGLLCVAVVSVAPFVGHNPVHLGRILAGRGDPSEIDILMVARIPRVLLGAVTGAALAAAGVALQAALRNPLASPFTLGISGGGALGAALAILFGLAGTARGPGVGLMSLMGCAGAVLVVHRLARVGRALPPATLLLAGVTISFVAGAGVMLVQSVAGPTRSFAIDHWLMGDLDVASYAAVLWAALPGLAAMSVLAWFGRDLNALAMGDEAAASVGVDAQRTLRLVYIASSVLVAATVAVAGPIGFIGLLAPHAVRGLCGGDHRVLLPCAAFGGATLLVVCDTLGRSVLPVGEIPVGVVVDTVGGVFFLILLVRLKARAVLWA